jgi:exonuclease III
MANLKCISLNVRGLRGNGKRKALFRLFRDNKFDVICLQETYITENVSTAWQLEWGGELYYSEGSNHSQGLVILIKKGLQHKVSLVLQKPRLLGINIETDTGPFIVLNVYAPNQGGEQTWFSEIASKGGVRHTS